MTTRRERIQWYVAGMKRADEALKEAYPDIPDSERRKYAAMFAHADGISDDLMTIQAAIESIEVNT